MIPDIAAALDHPGLFQPWFRGPSWDGWRAIIKAAHALPMTAAEIEFFKLVAGGREPPQQRVKEVWIISGRRSGKDSAASVLAAHAAAVFEPTENVRGGERPLVMCLAAERDQAKTILSYTRDYYATIPPLKTMVTRETQWGFELSNTVDISITTSDYRAIRGRTVLCAILDEVAFWRDDTSANPDVEVFRALRPALATLPDSMLIGITSAYRRAGLAYKRWEKYFGRDDPRVLVIMAETRQLNPLFDQRTIDEELDDDKESASAEYLSIWRDDLSGYVTREQVMAVVDRGITIRPPQSGVQYQAWVDASSGQGADSMCASIGHRGDSVAIVDHVIEIKPPFKPADAVAQIAATLKAYGITRCTGDKWALGFVATEFERNGIALEHGDKPGSELYRQCRPIITSLRCRLPDNDRMVGQFSNLEVRALPGGNERIDHPRGGHDDLSMVVAGLLVALSAELRGAEGWIEYYRRLNEAEGLSFSRVGTDMDPIRASGPQFGYDLNPPPVCTENLI